MIQLNSDLIELLAAFEKYGARYLIIGGHAVGFYAEPRYTKDIDLWIATDRKNAVAVHRALTAFGAPLHGGGPEIFQDDDAFFWFGHDPNRVDILMGPPGGVDFKDAWRRRVSAVVGDVKVHYVARSDLIALKEASGRSVDRRDIRALIESGPEPAKRKTGRRSRKRARPVVKRRKR